MRLRRTIALAAAVTAVAAAAVVYRLADPAVSPWMPRCAFKALTGWDCPGCGSQRMLHALLCGDWGAAWHANPFLLCAAPLLLAAVFAAMARTRLPRLYAALNSPAAIIAAAAAITAWTIGRNLLPSGS